MRIEVWVVKMPNGDRAYTSAMPPRKELQQEWCLQGGRVFRVWAYFPDDPSTPCEAGSWPGGGEELTPPPPRETQFLYKMVEVLVEDGRFVPLRPNERAICGPDGDPEWEFVTTTLLPSEQPPGAAHWRRHGVTLWRRPLRLEDRKRPAEEEL